MCRAKLDRCEASKSFQIRLVLKPEDDPMV